LIECLRAAPSIHTLSLTRLTGPSDPWSSYFSNSSPASKPGYFSI
jgi:hypothetical protein